MSLLTTAARAWLTRSRKPFRFTDAHSERLPYGDTKRLGLYVHIPFCRALCSFCPYCKVVYDPAMAGRYVEALLGEIDLVGQTGGGKKQVTSLYFGGGTPALMAEDIGRIIARLERYFTITEGVGVELHPEDVTEEKLRILRKAGVTKLSIGIQSFQGENLRLLGRGAFDPASLARGLAAVPFETVSMDFIFALPGQTIETLRRDIETAFQNGANHIAVYPFIDFSYTDRSFPKPTEGEKKRLLYDLVAYCDGKGYVRDSIWTFSKEPGAKYSSMTRDNFLGFGCSATTLLEGQFKINTFDVEAYIGRVGETRLPTAMTLEFTRRQRMVYYLFWTAYSMSVDGVGFRDFFGVELEEMYGGELWLAQWLGFAKRIDGRYVMTTKGSYYYHYFENFYTLSYIDQMWNRMRKDAFPRELVIG